jgi:hypothetical protein
VSKLKAESRIVLQACHDSLQRDAAGFVADGEVADKTGLALAQVRDCLESLEGNSFVELARVGESYKAMATPEGRLELRRPRPFAESADICMTLQRAGRLIRAGRFQELARLAVALLPVFVGFTLVAIAAFTAYKILIVPKTPTKIAAKQPVLGDDYQPCPPNVRGRNNPCDRLLPIKFTILGLRKSGFDVVAVIESEPFNEPYRPFRASTVLARAAGDMKPICVVFLIREQKDGTSLISLGREINGLSTENDVYQKLAYTVPESQRGDRLVVLAGLGKASYYETAPALKDSAANQGRAAFSIDVEP